MNKNIFFKKYLSTSGRRDITRSYGLLERFLAIQRAKIANRFISNEHKNGRILDIGCGSYPIFLLTAKFVEKFGIDKTCYPKRGVLRRFNLVNYDIETNSKNFPFPDNFINVITMLAVFEHIEHSKLKNIILEVYRILKPDGVFIVTVPCPWSNSILHIMAYLGLVSKIEMADHKTNLTNSKILKILKEANFSDIKSGYFELFLNRWFVAIKS